MKERQSLYLEIKFLKFRSHIYLFGRESVTWLKLSVENHQAVGASVDYAMNCGL